MAIEAKTSGRRPAHSARAWSAKMQILFYAAIVIAVALFALTLSWVRSGIQAGSVSPLSQPVSSGTQSPQSAANQSLVSSIPPSKPTKTPTEVRKSVAPPPAMAEASRPSVRPSATPALARTTAPPQSRLISLSEYEKAPSGYAGDQVIYYFDASWCPTCQAAVADFKRHQEKIPEDVVIVLADFDQTKDLQRRWGVTTQSTAVTLTNSGAKDRAFWAGSLRDVLSQA